MKVICDHADKCRVNCTHKILHKPTKGQFDDTGKLRWCDKYAVECGMIEKQEYVICVEVKE